MNKNECKKYLKRAYKHLKMQGTKINTENIELEMRKVIEHETKIYVEYAKAAINTINNSATEISPKELDAEVDVIVKIFKSKKKLLN